MQSEDSSLVHWTQSKANPARKICFRWFQMKAIIATVNIINICFHHEPSFAWETFLWKFNKDCEEDETGKSHGRSNICLKSRVRVILKILHIIQSRTKKTSPCSQQNKFFGLNNSISARTKIQHFHSENYSRCPINRNVPNFYLSLSRPKNEIRL